MRALPRRVSGRREPHGDLYKLPHPHAENGDGESRPRVAFSEARFACWRDQEPIAARLNPIAGRTGTSRDR